MYTPAAFGGSVQVFILNYCLAINTEGSSCNL